MKAIKFYIDAFSGLSRDVWCIALIYLVNRSGEMVIPFMSVYLIDQLGFSLPQSGIVLTCFGIGAMIGSNIGGQLSDRIGNFNVMALSLGAMGCTFIGINFFTDYLYICLWMIVVGITSSMFSPAAFSAVGKWGIPENQTRGYSLLRMAINLGISIGPAVGGFVAFKFGYQWLFILDGVTCFLALITLFVVLGHRRQKISAKKTHVASAKSPYEDWALILFLFLNLINMIAFFQILFAVPTYFKTELNMDEWIIGAFFTANGLLVLFLEMPLVYLIEKSNKYFKPLAAGAIIIGISYACLSIFDAPLVAIILYSLLVAFGEVINFPLIPSLAMRRAEEHSEGKYMGMVSTMFAMAFMLAPLLGNPIVALIGSHNYFFIAAGLSVVSGCSLWLLRSQFVK